jgi:hypothetical protein
VYGTEKMIAEALPLTDRVATKTDLDRVVENLLAQIDARFGGVDGNLGAMEARIYRWMLTFNATLFLGLAGMIVAILLKS